MTFSLISMRNPDSVDLVVNQISFEPADLAENPVSFELAENPVSFEPADLAENPVFFEPSTT